VRPERFYTDKEDCSRDEWYGLLRTGKPWQTLAGAQNDFGVVAYRGTCYEWGKARMKKHCIGERELQAQFERRFEPSLEGKTSIFSGSVGPTWVRVLKIAILSRIRVVHCDGGGL
jgi:hypothetical protein